MSKEVNLQFVRPFGPIICKVTMPIEIVNSLNEYVDEIWLMPMYNHMKEYIECMTKKHVKN